MGGSAASRPLKGRASPTGNRAGARRTSSPDRTGSVGVGAGNGPDELGIHRPLVVERPIANRERELGLDRRETG